MPFTFMGLALTLLSTVTKLGRLVKDGRIKSVEEVYLYSMPVKEPEIMDYFFKDSLKDEVM